MPLNKADQHRNGKASKQPATPATPEVRRVQVEPAPAPLERKSNGTTRITLKLTAKEIELLSSLASDQLFRREFIDPRLPGHRSNPAELSLGKQLVERLRLTTGNGAKLPLTKRNGASA